MGIMDAAIGSLSNVINDSIEKIKELKILTMNEVFNELKEKINRYNELSKETERLGVNNSEVAKVEEEIRNLKSKIDELNSSIEFKSKIEKMKITLNVTSIESEITLKEINLEEEKKKAEKDYDSRIQIFNKNLEDTKKELEEFIKNIEKTLEKTVKREAKKRGSKNLELPDLQKKGLNKLGLSVLDLSEVSHLVALELKALEKLSTYSEEEIEKLNLTDMSDINKTTAILTGIGGIIGASYSITAIPNGIAIKPYLRRLIIIKNNKPCIYIDANGLTGSYMLRIGYVDENTGNSEYWRYLSSFEKQYPVKEKCIFADESNFPNINFRNNVSYSFTLKAASVPRDDRHIPNNFDGFSSTYCLKNTNGKFEVQDFDFSKNRCVDKVEILSSSDTKQRISWLDLLFRWFMDLWK